MKPPSGACDCHAHVFGPFDRFPLASDRPYTPGEARLDDLRAMHEALGVERVVIVAASPYDTDNAALIDALRAPRRRGPRRRRARPRRARGRRPRRRCTRPGSAACGSTSRASAPRTPRRPRRSCGRPPGAVARLRWHVDLHAGLDVVAALKDTIATSPAPTVVDHFGLADPADGPAHPGFAALRDLAASGAAYVKLSAPERIADDPDGDRVAALARALLDAAPDRMLWASDWPHTGGGPHGGGARDPDRVEPFRDRGRRARARTPARVDARRRRGPPRARHEPRAALRVLSVSRRTRPRRPRTTSPPPAARSPFAPAAPSSRAPVPSGRTTTAGIDPQHRVAADRPRPEARSEDPQGPVDDAVRDRVVDRERDRAPPTRCRRARC